ncbi:DUF6932 family protein [Paraburkholderia xenovorans]
MMPPLDATTGLLPPGIHNAAWPEFVQYFGTNKHRSCLIQLLLLLLGNLASAGCTKVYVDGSFVTSKLLPSDYDLCWDPSGVAPNLIDPVLLDFSNGRSAMKLKYGGDIFAASWAEGQSGKTFLDFFQIDKATGNPKGIVMLIPQEAI